MKLSRTALTATACALFSIAAVAIPSGPLAQAAPVALSPVAQANPTTSQRVIDSLPAAVRDSNVTIDPSINEDTVIFYPDGTLVPGQSPKKMARGALIQKAGGCGQSTGFWGAPFTWGPTATQNCGVFGYKGFRRYYSWSANPGVFSQAVVQGGGFKCHNYVELPLPGSDCGRHGYVATWGGLGAGKSGGGYVFWGNVLAQPKVRAQSLAAPAGFSGTFR